MSADLSARWRGYTNFSFRDCARAADGVPTARLRGRQGHYTYHLVRRGDDFTLSLYDGMRAGALVRIGRSGGTGWCHGSAAAEVHASFHELAALECDLLTGAVGERACTPRPDASRFGVRFGELEVDVVFDGAGRCSSIDLCEPLPWVSRYVPVSVLELAGGRRLYAAWRRDGQSPLTIEALELGGKVLDGELLAPNGNA